MDLDIKGFLEHNKKLFNDDLTLEASLVNRHGEFEADEDLRIIISAYFEKLQAYRECENTQSVIAYVKDDDSKSTIHELDRECSRSNRYLQPLCIALLKFETTSVAEDVIESDHLSGLERTAREALRKTDYVGKLTNKELLILLPNTDVDLGDVVSGKIQAALNNSIKEQVIRVKYTMSYTNYERWESYELLLKRLQHGLFKAGRDKKKSARI